MAKKEQFRYGGFIKSQTGIDIIHNIDMCNLPYDLFGPEFPLEILADVDMGPNNKRPPLPDMTGVKIYGSFDCSNYKINEDTVLPQEIVQLVCLFSIRDLGVLIGKIPSSVQQIVVQKPVLNAIKRAATKKATPDERQKLDDARAFVQAYPHITVTDKDGKLRLSNILSDIDAAANTPVVAPTKQAKAPKPELPIQTDNYLTAKDLEEKCMKALKKEGLQAPQAAIKRYIKQAFKVVPTHEMIRKSDGATVKCVHKDDTDNVVEKVTKLVKANIDRQTESKPVQSTSKKTQDKPAAQPASGKKGYYFNGFEINPIKINKYILKTQWSYFSKKYQPDVLLMILHSIQDINVNQSTVVRPSGKKPKAIFIKDDKVELAQNVEFKHAKCLTQSDTRDMQSRVRILWGVCGNNFICDSVCENHDKDKRYNSLIRNMDIQISDLDLSKYLLVSDLIKELETNTVSATNDVKETDAIEPEATGVATKTSDVTEQLVEAETAATTVSEPVVEKTAQTDTRKEYIAPTITIKDATKPGTPDDGDDSKPVAGTTSPDVPQQSEQPTAKQRAPRTRIVRAPTETRVEVPSPVKIAVDTPVKEDVAPVARPYKWASLYHLNSRLIAKYNATVRHQQELLQALSTQMDTEQLLQTTQKLQQVLETKKKIEAARKELEQKNDELFEFIDKIHQMLH